MYTLIHEQETFLIYEIPNAKEVAVVEYQSDNAVAKERAVKILGSLEKI